MTNAPHILETALLMLAVFLAGAVIGYVARLLARGKAPVVAPVAVAAPAVPTGPQLVMAPEIAPLSVAKPTAAERFAAAAGNTEPAPVEAPATPAVPGEAPLMPAVKMPEVAPLPEFAPSTAITPARVAGETMSGRHIDNPEHISPAPAAVIQVPPAAAELGVIALVPLAADAPAVAEISTRVVEALEAAETRAVMETQLVVEEPVESSLDDVRAELEAMTPDEIEAPMPVEERVEPELAAEPEVEVTDTPDEVEEEMLEVTPPPAEGPVPDVVAEAPLVESSFDEDRFEDLPIAAAPADAVPVAEEMLPTPAAEMGDEEPVDDETAAMRAIEGGWTPRRSSVPRPAAALPEGVPADVIAADRAVAAASAAVAQATATATAVLEEIAPVRPMRTAGGFGRPPGLDEPRNGRMDDFSQIKGLAPAIESSLNALGIYHYDQIADWDQKGVVWIENHFGLKGRVAREHWQEQARELSRARGHAARPVRR